MAEDYRPLVIVYDVNPNSNYAEWAAAEYEADAMAEEDVHDWAFWAAENAKLYAWDKMLARAPLDPHHPRNTR